MEYVIPMMVYTVFSEKKRSMESTKAKNQALWQQQEERDWWKANAYPSEGAVSAMKTEGQTGLADMRSGSYQQMASNLASRGVGPGSGIMKEGAEGIEKGYLQGIGRLTSDLTKFAHTPQFAPPAGTTIPNFADGGGMLDTAMGMFMAQQMFKSWGGGNDMTFGGVGDEDAYWGYGG